MKPTRAGIGIDLNRSAVARYIQLAGLYRRRIVSAEWPVGQQIPSVDELAEECGVARATIRQSLDSLAEEGLIERVRGTGTFVRAKPEVQMWSEVEIDWPGVLMPRLRVTLKTILEESGKQPPHLRHPIGTRAASYRRMRRVHFIREKPYFLSDIYVDERLCSRLSRKDFRTKPVFKLIGDIEGLKIADARQTLTIGTADVETAFHLNIPINSPVAIVHRSALDDQGCLVLVATGAYRGDALQIDMKLKSRES